jgi:hypothetical protein
VINPNKVLEKMAEVRARPSPSLLARLSMMQQHHPVFRTYYVHKSMADGSLYWSSDDRTAERFGTAQEALAFARTHLDGGIRVAEHRLWNGCDGPPPP